MDLFDFSVESIIPNIFLLKSQGYIEEFVEEIPANKLIHKYKVKDIENKFKENYFKSVAIIHDNKVCCNCGLCSSICPSLNKKPILTGLQLTFNVVVAIMVPVT